ncbi:carbohydrate ABC transporter permease [Paenibacillus thalictri]|uniref:Carbohydrate ABC transporter permease n=1 Tax=Paenibacillus thalictri TaxID=2527873 RepID=A0A4Q9DUK0_9BACL|nr:carbohydrate ABC transporter permease [Paenibacillus thalictri]TBL80684.1 carbohydrate ABC transporter permease [Paenibacillus thalictri]
MVKPGLDRIFNVLMYAVLMAVGAAALFPLLYVVSVSITPYAEVMRNGGFILIPRQITFAAYAELLKQNYLLTSFNVTVFITVVGTLINLAITCLFAYPLSRKNLPLRSFFLFLVVFTMLFGGGMIPTYLIVKQTGLLDSVWAMIVPTALSAFNLLILKSFFENLPEEIFESARMDGAKEFRILLGIAIPLSLPALFTVGLFYMVGHWNEFFQAIMYITKRELHPLQVIVREMLTKSQTVVDNVDEVIPTTSLQMASVIYASLPIIVVYPFIQKHFSKGMVIGAIKG